MTGVWPHPVEVHSTTLRNLPGGLFVSSSGRGSVVPRALAHAASLSSPGFFVLGALAFPSGASAGPPLDGARLR